MTEIRGIETTDPAEAASAPVPASGRSWWQLDEAKLVLVPLIMAIVVLSIYTNSQNDAFLSWTNAENILLQTAVLGIIAIGQTFLMAAGQFDLSVGSLASLSAVVGATMLADGQPEPLVVLVCLILGALVGLAWGLIVTRLRVPPFILTLGGLSVLQSLALVRAKDVPVPARNTFAWLTRDGLLGIRSPIIAFLMIALLSALVLRYTRFGRHVFATGSSEEAAYLAGIPTDRTKVLVFMINSTLVAFAGLVLMSRIGAGDPRAGEGLELRAIAAVVLGGASLAGGRGSAGGTFLGVVLLGVVGASLTFLDVDGSYTDFVFGGVLIFAVVLTAVAEMRRGNEGMLRQLLKRPAKASQVQIM